MMFRWMLGVPPPITTPWPALGTLAGKALGLLNQLRGRWFTAFTTPRGLPLADSCAPKPGDNRSLFKLADGSKDLPHHFGGRRFVGEVIGRVNGYEVVTQALEVVMADACEDCPPFIRTAVEAPVVEATRNIRAIKQMSNFLNEALKTLVEDLQSKIATVVAAIPLPPIVDLGFVVDLLTCPLTPVAVALDPVILAALDPEALWKQAQGAFQAYLSQIVSDYENALADLQEFNVVKLAKQYYEDLKRIALDVEVLAFAVAITEYVKVTCPDEFANGPYQEFEDEVDGFTLAGLFVPVDELDPEVVDTMLELGAAEAIFEAWRVLATSKAPWIL